MLTVITDNAISVLRQQTEPGDIIQGTLWCTRFSSRHTLEVDIALAGAIDTRIASSIYQYIGLARAFDYRWY